MNVWRKKQVGRNEPCPCGSGKKYKRCCAERSVGQNRWFAEFAALRRELSRGECSVPPPWKGDCSTKIADAHTVPRASLGRIAAKGHVLSFLQTATGFMEHGSAAPPQRRGIRQASTFTGFCTKHDDAVFAPLEKVPFEGTKEQCFLLAYRALARELYLKRGVSRYFVRRGAELSKELGIPEELALGPVGPFVEGTAQGKEDLESYKLEYDKALSNQEYSKVKGYVIEFAGAPPVMCSGGVFPEHTFDGERLQVLAPSLGRPSQMCFSSFADAERGFVVFAWLDDGLDHCDRLVESLKQTTDAVLCNRLLKFFFECCENVHIQPCWWEKLPKSAQEKLIGHMDVSSEFFSWNHARDFFSDDGVDYGSWPIVRKYAVP